MPTRRTRRSKRVDASHREDCILFNPRNTRVRYTRGRWKIVDGRHAILDLKKAEWEADTALAVIKNFDMDSICFVGRPGPSMTYFLSAGKAPAGAMTGEDAVRFSWRNAKVKRLQNRWKIVDGSHWLMDFGNKRSEATKALAILKKYRFNKMCFVGRPKPSMTYFLRGKKAPGYATKWVIPEIRIKLDWNTNRLDARLRRARALCEAFNVRLFDATDGQCRVAKFTIYDKSRSLKSTDKGVGHIFRAGPDQHGHSNGRPDTPNHFHVRLPAGNPQMRQQAGTMFMEWCHSYTGTRDEYETIDHEPATHASCTEPALIQNFAGPAFTTRQPSRDRTVRCPVTSGSRRS